MLNSNPCTPDKPAQMGSVLWPMWLRGGQGDGLPSSPPPPPLPAPKLGRGEKASKGQKDQTCPRWHLVAWSHTGFPEAWGPAGCAQPLEGCSNPGKVPTLTQCTSQLCWEGPGRCWGEGQIGTLKLFINMHGRETNITCVHRGNCEAFQSDRWDFT